MISVVNSRDTIWKVWTPVMKAEDMSESGRYLVKGVASTGELDQQNESVVQKGIDAQPLLDRGIINWNHMSMGRPGAIIGVPTSASLNAEGNFEIEGELYKGMPQAEEAYELLCYYDAHPEFNRQLGWSIEGRGIRKGGYVVKTVVHHCALTHDFVNTGTFAGVVKAMCLNIGLDGCELTPITKAMSTMQSAPLLMENLDSGQLTDLLRQVFFGEHGEAKNVFVEHEGKQTYREGPLSAHMQLVAMGLHPKDATQLLVDLRDAKLLG